MLEGFDSGTAGPGAGPSDADLVFDVGTADFKTKVIDASNETPILVDFWAPWCGPCRQLSPVLEAVVKGARGAVKLAKLDTEAHPSIAQQIMGALGIQSIPAVIAFDKGQPVDGFVGALPESQIKSFIEKLTGPTGPSPVEQMLEAGEAALTAGDAASALQAFGTVAQSEPQNAAAVSGVARAYLALGDAEAAAQVLDGVPEAMRNDPALASALAQLDLVRQTSDLGDLTELEGRLEADPSDHQTRFDLALAHNQRGDKTAAVEALLEIVKRDREWNEDGARKQLVQLFDAWGAADPATAFGRKALASVLFS